MKRKEKNILKMDEIIREKIAAVLATVTAANSPSIYNLIQTESGYKIVEEQLIQKVCKNNFTLSACIPHLESEL